MTLEEALDRGMVPSAPIVAVVRQQNMVEDAMLHHPRVWFRMTEEGQEFMEFDTVDKMLCAMHLHTQWRRGELHDLYYGVNLSRMPRLYVNTRTGERMCAAIGCSNIFQRQKKPGAYDRQKYCSTKCRQRDHRMKKGLKQEGHKGKYHIPIEGREFVCRNGHIRNPDNTEVLKSGVRRCKECNRERTREYRERRRAAQAVAA